jgi:hypothetical protein
LKSKKNDPKTLVILRGLKYLKENILKVNFNMIDFLFLILLFLQKMHCFEKNVLKNLQIDFISSSLFENSICIPKQMVHCQPMYIHIL